MIARCYSLYYSTAVVSEAELGSIWLTLSRSFSTSDSSPKGVDFMIYLWIF
jgi:hypothetical protein